MFAYVYQRDVELYRYFLVSSAAIAAVAAASTKLPLPRVRPEVVAAAATVALAIYAGSAWHNNRGLAAELRYRGNQSTIDAVRHDVPDGAIIVTSWYDATTLGYGAAIEHALGSRTVVHGLPFQFVDQFPSWAHVRRVVIFGWGTELRPRGRASVLAPRTADQPAILSSRGGRSGFQGVIRVPRPRPMGEVKYQPSCGS